MSTALITHEAGLDHVTPFGHPERVDRLVAVTRALEDLDLHRVTAREATEAELLRGHPQRYIDRIRNAEPTEGVVQLDADTWMSPGSFRAGLVGTGAALQAVDMVMAGEVNNAFCATRPPGHHAETETPMGFCLFGNAALAAMHALEAHGLSRVAVVDFDVHHGNGTQDLLWNEPRALFITSQQMPLWPGSGHPTERGAHDQILNLPLPPESGGAEMRARYQAEALPRLRAFAPELVILSAGFDAHQDDPLAQLNWTVADFVWVTQALCAVAAETAGGRVVSTLEGGYDLAALGVSVRAHVEGLMEAGA